MPFVGSRICTGVKPDGTPCGSAAVTGKDVCYHHGGGVSPRKINRDLRSRVERMTEEAAEQIAAATSKLQSYAERAAEILNTIAEDDTVAAGVRVSASKAVIEYAGAVAPKRRELDVVHHKDEGSDLDREISRLLAELEPSGQGADALAADSEARTTHP